MPSRSAKLLAVAISGAVEAVTYLVLLAAVVWKRALHGPDVVPAAGLAHGVVFLAYAAAVLRARSAARWDATTTVQLLAASALPAGGFVVARRARSLR